jgi:hypothetical protein
LFLLRSLENPFYSIACSFVIVIINQSQNIPLELRADPRDLKLHFSLLFLVIGLINVYKFPLDNSICISYNDVNAEKTLNAVSLGTISSDNSQCKWSCFYKFIGPPTTYHHARNRKYSTHARLNLNLWLTCININIKVLYATNFHMHHSFMISLV